MMATGDVPDIDMAPRAKVGVAEAHDQEGGEEEEQPVQAQQALQQQYLSPNQGIQAPVAPMPAEVPVDDPRASEEQGGESPRPGTMRRAKDKVKGLLRRFMGGNQS